MTKRKRTADEQKLFDELEALRVKRRTMAEGITVARAAFEATSLAEDKAIVLVRAGNVLSAIALLSDYDSKIMATKAIYDALRKKNDSLS